MIGRKVAGSTSVAVYRRDGAGNWNFEDTLDTGAVTDISLNPTFVEAVTVVGREVRFHKQSFPPDWVYFGTSSGVTVPEGGDDPACGTGGKPAGGAYRDCFRDRAARPEGRTTPPTDPDERN